MTQQKGISKTNATQDSRVQNDLKKNTESFLKPNPHDLMHIFYLSKDIRIMTQVKVATSSIRINAAFTYSNGEPITLKQSYLLSFLQEINQISGQNYYYTNWESNQIRLKTKIKFLYHFPAIETLEQYIIQKFKPHLGYLKKLLIHFGVFSSLKSRSMVIKQSIKLSKQLGNIFNNTLTQNIICSTESQQSTCQNVQKIQLEDGSSLMKSIQWDSTCKQSSSLKVSKQRCVIHKGGQAFDSAKDLAIKCLNQTVQQQSKTQKLAKIQRQIRIVKKLPLCKYFLQYYIPSEKQYQNQYIFMQYISESLTFYIYNGLLSIDSTFEIFSQILEAIQILHSSGVVHRDLKPDNILIRENNGKKDIAIIDFGDSAQTSQTCSPCRQPLGFTLPYSPFQCISNFEEGVNDPKIDVWSAGALLHEIFYQVPPCIYDYFYQKQTVQGLGKNQFCLCLGFKKRKGIRILQHFINILIYCCLTYKSSKRIHLNVLFQMVKAIHDIEKQFKKQIKQDFKISS